MPLIARLEMMVIDLCEVDLLNQISNCPHCWYMKLSVLLGLPDPIFFLPLVASPVVYFCEPVGHFLMSLTSVPLGLRSGLAVQGAAISRCWIAVDNSMTVTTSAPVLF